MLETGSLVEWQRGSVLLAPCQPDSGCIVGLGNLGLPFGRAEKLPSAVLSCLERAGHFLPRTPRIGRLLGTLILLGITEQTAKSLSCYIQESIVQRRKLV
jgi:hypothetical protein